MNVVSSRTVTVTVTVTGLLATMVGVAIERRRSLTVAVEAA